jgi:UDP-2,4-diacetamido-2,4,6-trideoxy-beta-L-altropyranose hydrolase
VSRASPESRIVFRCDANRRMGGGHVMRCLALANALAEARAQVTFAAAAMPDALEERIASAGHQLKRIPASPEMQRNNVEWEEPPLSAQAQLTDANATGAAVGPADWTIVDHYLLDANWHSAARGFAGQILVIDDLANRSYDCDILLDQTLGRPADNYRAQVPDSAKILVGPTYALLRPEFARQRPAALKRRETGGPVRRILVSMGTADPDGITAKVIERVVAVAPDCAIDAVLGAEAVSLERLGQIAADHPGVHIHRNSERMAELMRDADIAIGAAGTTSWERCALALPAIVLVLAENQRLSAQSLERAGAVVLTDSIDAVHSSLASLMDDPPRRLTMSAAAAAITDGSGSQLIAEVLISQRRSHENELKLRGATQADSPMVWLWRNDFVTRKFSQSTAPVPWPDHKAWWRSMLKSTERELLVAEFGGRPFAALRFDQLGGGGFEVSINLAPSARNSGLGGRILAEACRIFRDLHGPVRLVATVHRENSASRKIFEKLGFVRTDSLSDSPFDRYVLAEGSAQ